MRDYQIDGETASGIALAVMVDHYKYLEKELDDHIKNGTWLHPEDKRRSQYVLIPALRTLIEYFGGDPDDGAE